MQTDARENATPSASGMLLVLILVSAGAAVHWGAFAWPALALMLAATALAFWLHLRPDLRGPSPDGILTGLLIAFAAAAVFQQSGQGQTTQKYTLIWSTFKWDKTDLDVYGLSIRLLAAVALVGACAYLLRVRERMRRFAFVLLVLLAFAMQLLMIKSTPLPGIDVFHSQTYAGRELLNGKNIYEAELPSPYSNQAKLDHYGYPPLNVYANCISWHLFRDVRGLWIACIFASAFLMYRLARGTHPGPDGRRFAELVTLAFLFLPRTLFVVEQSWTEPLTLVTMSAFALAAAAGRGSALTGVLLGLWLNSKQYAVLAAPLVVKLWPRRANLWLYAILTGVVVTLPFALWDWAALYRALFGFFLKSMGRPDGLSLYAAFIWAGIELDWWMTVPLWLAGLTFFTWRMPRTLSGMLFATASMWLFFFLLGKQAFMNYFYAISFAILLAVAATVEGERAGCQGARD